MPRTAVIDFETTGLSPLMGDRATEVAIVLLEGDRVVDRFQSLMNAGVRISAFIESFTGISNAMVAAAPPAAQVMADAARFVGDTPLVAHNASFDRRFWTAELERAGVPAAHQPSSFVCTLLLSRRLHPRPPATNWARWPGCTGWPTPAGPTGRWPMPRWPPPCWPTSGATCAAASACRMPTMRCWCGYRRRSAMRCRL